MHLMRPLPYIARSQGFDVRDPLAQAECIQVFAMGGPSEGDDAAESAYYGMRNAMVMAAQEVGISLAEVAAKQSLGRAPQEASSVLVRLIEVVAKRLGIQVTEKMAAQAVPVVGAVSGAAINVLFTRHFQDMARGHFTVLRLEQRYGKEAVSEQYLRIKQELNAGKV